MPTKERVAEVFADRELKRDHHPFLDEMRKFFLPEKFARVLAASKEQYGTYSPSGDVPVWDSDVLKKVDTVVATARDNYPLSSTQERDIRAAAHFAIWAHGTDTKFEKKRFRHERKEDGSFQPYAIHFARVAERLTDFDPITLQIAFLHDVLENTRYTEENLEDIFGSDIARACKKVCKISTDSLEDLLEDLDQVELGVARDFLNQFRQDEAVDRIVTYLDDQMKTTAYYRNLTVGEFEKYSTGQEYFRDRKLISEALKQYARGEDEAQMLTLIRLLSVFENESDVRALIIKCADSADNMASIEGLVTGRGREKAEGKARIARNIFAPLARVLGLDSFALEIEDPTFFILEPTSAKAVSKKLDRLDKIDRSVERVTERKIKQFIQEFITWANERSGDISFSGDAIRVVLRYPRSCEIHRHQVDLKTRISPFVEIYVRDKFTLSAFYEFLTEVASAKGEKVTSANLVNVFGERVKSTSFRFTALRHNRDLMGFIYDSSGDVVDMFRPAAPAWQRINGSDKFRGIFTHLKSGDYSDFLTALQTGRVVKVTLFRSGTNTPPRDLFVPVEATVEDALILAGYSRLKPAVIRNGTVVAVSNLQSGDTIALTDRTDGRSLDHPATIDRLATSASRKRLSVKLRGILDDEHNGSRDIVRLGARFRGIRILTVLSDIRAAQILYRRFDSNNYKSEFFKSLLESHRALIEHIVTDKFLIDLGITPSVFPSDQLSVSREVYKDWLEIPHLGSILNRMIRWVGDNCYEVRPSGGFGKRGSATANSREESIALSEYLRRLYDLSEGVLREAIYIPVAEGQISPENPLYIAIDPFRLGQYAKSLHIDEKEALDRLFGRANKVIERFID